MQNQRTLQFWDQLHLEQEKEWILQPTEPLLTRIVESIPRKRPDQTTLRILEIGCGTSKLALELWRLIQIQEKAQHTPRDLCVVATDVSEVCIHQNIERDGDILKADAFHGFEYRVLNATEDHPEMEGKFDVILDKGCLDTFLFRSKQRGGSRPYAPLVRKVLDNIHSWLCDTGVYLILTPRPKHKTVRDFSGFASFQRHSLDSTITRGEIEGDDDRSFLYTCRKEPKYHPGASAEAFAIDQSLPKDDEICPACRQSFLQFRKDEDVFRRGKPFWIRAWKGHSMHCKKSMRES